MRGVQRAVVQIPDQVPDLRDILLLLQHKGALLLREVAVEPVLDQDLTPGKVEWAVQALVPVEVMAPHADIHCKRVEAAGTRPRRIYGAGAFRNTQASSGTCTFIKKMGYLPGRISGSVYSLIMSSISMSGRPRVRR